MSQRTQELVDRAVRLRNEFDNGFAEARNHEPELFEDFLTLRVGDDVYAVRLLDLSGLFVDRRIVPLPSAAPGFLGVTGFRDCVVPIYSLRALLGYPGESAPSKWIILLKGKRIAGLALEQFQAHLRVPRADIAPSARSKVRSPCIRDAIRSGAATLPVLDARNLIEEIERRSRFDGTPEER